MASLLLNKAYASYFIISEDNITVLKGLREVNESQSKQTLRNSCVFQSLEADEQSPSTQCSPALGSC